MKVATDVARTVVGRESIVETPARGTEGRANRRGSDTGSRRNATLRLEPVVSLCPSRAMFSSPVTMLQVLATLVILAGVFGFSRILRRSSATWPSALANGAIVAVFVTFLGGEAVASQEFADCDAVAAEVAAMSPMIVDTIPAVPECRAASVALANEWRMVMAVLATGAMVGGMLIERRPRYAALRAAGRA